MSKPYPGKEIEQKWTNWWLEQKVYGFEYEKDKKIFNINTPPPYPSGEFHAGNILNWCYFDFIARFKRMCGYAVHFPQGWDVHGLPTESKVEQTHGKKSSEVPRHVWVKWCEEWTNKYIAQMKEMINALGISIDWSFEYKTSDPEYIKMIQLSFLRLLEKGLAYRGKHPVNWCTNCRTAIADAEVEYRTRDAKLWHVRFPLVSEGEIVIATTRPELLPACVGIAVNPEDERYKEIVGRRALVPIFGQEVEIFASDSVDPTFGTGIVMICTFGDKADVEWAFKHRLPIIDAINEKGELTEAAGKYAGLDVRAAKRQIVNDLDAQGYLLHEETINQNVGVCWRCKNPIEILNKEQWFLRATQFTEQVVEATKACKWWPGHMAIRQIQWAQSMTWDWVISRQKVYGTPIPVWYCNSCNNIIPATEEELPIDPVDVVKTCPKCGMRAKGESDRMDTWMDSSMSNYWHAGWPRGISDPKDPNITIGWEKFIPASLQPNGFDIIRTWDYYLMLRSLMISGKPAYENVLINGMVLGEDGRKMSKSLGNFITARDIFEKSYADAVRYWAARSTPGNDYPFSWAELQHAERFYTKLWNIVQFFKQHFEKEKAENVDALIDYNIENLEMLDRWILSRLQRLIEEITDDFNHYNFSIIKIEEFLWHELADYYIEIVKDRLYSGRKAGSATWTLYRCLLDCIKLLAPFAPYITEEIYQNIFKKYEKVKSIHLAEWPKTNKELINPEAEQLAKKAKDIIATIRQYKMSSRLPLSAPLKSVIIECEEIWPIVEDIKGTIKAQEIKIGRAEQLRTTKYKIGIDVMV
jgi:valyl-tRNA synthetase